MTVTEPEARSGYPANRRVGGYMRASAEHHAECIADTGDGYVLQHAGRRSWTIDCLWCPWALVTNTKREAVEAYRTHEGELMALLQRDLRGRDALDC